MGVFKYLFCFSTLLTVQTIYSQNISWDKTHGPYGGYTSALYKSKSGNIYASGRGVIYSKYSDDLRWNLILRTNTNSFASTVVENSSGDIFVSFGIGTYRSSDNGATWQLMDSGITGLAINKLTIDEQDNFYTSAVISNSFKIFKSIDSGFTWEEVYDYSPMVNDYSIIQAGDNGLILVGLHYHIFRSTNYGQSWENITYPNLGSISNINIMDNGQTFLTESNIEIWKSTDYGTNWFVVSVAPTFQSISFIKNDSNYNLYLGLNEHYDSMPWGGLGGVYKSTDGGQTWIDLTFDLINREVLSLEFVNDNIWIGTYGKGVQELRESDSTWTNNNIGMTDIIITSITFDKLNRIWVSTSRGGIFISNDEGNNWMERSKGLIWPTGYDISVSDNNDIFLVDHLGVYRFDSTNVTWEIKLTLGYSNDGTKSIGIKDNDTIFVGSLNSGIAVSYNNGETWNWNPPYYSDIQSIKVLADRTILAGGVHLYRSTDNGVSWSSLFHNYSSSINDIKQTYEGQILCGCGVFAYYPPYSGYLYLSSDSGQNWTDIIENIDNPYINCMQIYTNNRIFIGTKGNGIYLTTNYGNDWQALNDGLDNLYIHSIAVDKIGNIYAGTEEGLYKGNSKIITAISNQELPEKFCLVQNYPNPFNPSTTISYKIPEKSFVTIKVYDVLGNEITTLVNKEKSAGSYEVEFNGAVLPSGIYFYQLSSGNFVETRKMVLMK